MSARPWMPFYVQDFQMGTLALSPDETGIYIKLLCLAWHNGDGSITGDMKELKNVLQRLFTNFHGLTFNRVVPKLLSRYFKKRDDGRFYQERVENELRRVREISEKQSRIAGERWSKHNKNKDMGDANAMPSHSLTLTRRFRVARLRSQERQQAVRGLDSIARPSSLRRRRRPLGPGDRARGCEIPRLLGWPRRSWGRQA
jgi:uncharacterized protein YdaU (DUF1376 family)